MAAVNLLLAAIVMLASALLLLTSTRDRGSDILARRPADFYTRRLIREGTGARRRHQELSHKLRQAGYIGVTSHIAVLTFAAVVVVATGMAATLLLQAGGAALGRSLLFGLGGASAMVVLLMAALRNRIHMRRKRMENSIEMVIQVTRMLWGTGMTLETLFQRMIDHLEDVAPDAIREIEVALARIKSGQEREVVLETAADYQPYSGLADYFRLLAQVSTTGGRSSEALLTLGELLRDGRRIQLQEKMTKVSAKMSLVMMLFFFPALLIILAGPAFVSLGGMLRAMGGS